MATDDDLSIPFSGRVEITVDAVARAFCAMDEKQQANVIALIGAVALGWGSLQRDTQALSIGRRLRSGGSDAGLAFIQIIASEDDFPCDGFKGCENRVSTAQGTCGACDRRNERENAGGCPGCGGSCRAACR